MYYVKLLFLLIPLFIMSCHSATQQQWQSDQNEVTCDGTTPTISRPFCYKLVWSDDFSSGVTPDTNKWNYDLGSPLLGGSVWGNNEKEHYTNSSQNAYISDGNLVIQAKHETPTGAANGIIASSARLKSNTQDFYNAIGSDPYGYYEIRAKFSCTSGSWPAIWLLGKTGDWPANGEIDVMEWSGKYFVNSPNKIINALHMSSNHGGNPIKSEPNVSNLCNQYHNFQLHWLEDRIIIGVDGESTLTYIKPENATNDNWPYSQPSYIILNVAVGGTLGGYVNTNDIKDMSMHIDYVKVWKN